jgi:hypothetical protein
MESKKDKSDSVHESDEGSFDLAAALSDEEEEVVKPQEEPEIKKESPARVV